MHRSRILAALGTIIGLGLALMPPAGAAENMDPTVVVLDASGSMLQKDVGGQTRMDAAKQATTEFVSEAPKDAQLGLVTYGTGTGSSDAEKEAGCRDITVLARPGEKPSDALKNEVNGLQPRGYTPIGNSLLKANELLPKDGKRSIVLVSDGIDTCAPPPVCDVAKQLKEQGTDLVVHTIGFMVDDAARAELTCVANVTGGTYADASSKESLKATLTKAATRTAVGYQAAQKTIEFTPNQGDAQTLEVGTVDNPARVSAKPPTMPMSKNSFVKVNFPNNHRLHVGYTVVPNNIGTRMLGEPYGLGMGIYGPGASSPYSCGDTYENYVSSIDDDEPELGWLMSTKENSKNCPPDKLYLGVRTDDAPHTVDMTVAAVPIPSDKGDAFNESPSTARTKTDVVPFAAGNTAEVKGGTQPDNAPEVKDTATSEIVEGETQYFAAPVGWGQALDATVEVLDDPSDKENSVLDKIGRVLKFSAVNSLGEKQHLIENTDTLKVADIKKPVATGTMYPISYANVDVNDIQQRTAWLGGKNYFRVRFESYIGRTDEHTQLKPVKYRVTLRPSGKEVAGPKFDNTAMNSSGGADSRSSSMATPDSTAQAQNTGLSRWLYVGVGALAVLLLVVVGIVMWVVRRSRG